MKKTAAAASALALGALATPAHAEEPGDQHDWTGFYMGAAAGVNSARSDWKIDGGEGFVTDDGSVDESETLGLLGVAAGYDHQFGSLVVGGILDYTHTNVEENARFDGGEGASLRTSIENVGTLRARVGYAMNKVLCFVSGGLAVGDAEAVYDSDGSPSTKKVETPVGWVAGGGFEVAVSEKVSFVAETYYARFEDEGTAQGPFYDDKFDVEMGLVVGRLGLNVRF